VKIPLACIGLRDGDIATAIRVLNSGDLTMGSQVKEFENEMAKYLGVKYFVMMNSGSSANLAMVEALLRPAKSNPLLKAGDHVLVPAIAWPTTIWPIIQLGLEPVFVDIVPTNLAMDLNLAQKAVDDSNGKIKALFPIHPLGYSISPKELEDFTQRNNLVLINDVCESLGSWREGKHAGTSGIGGSFSFYFSHHITTMEGGGVATNDDLFADDLRSIRSHGWSRDRKDVKDWTGGVSGSDSKFLFVSTGYNIRPMEIQAAIGLSQIKDIDSFISRRRAIAEMVNSSIQGTKLELIDAGTITNSSDFNHSWMLLPLQVMGPEAARKKHEIIAALEKAEIETRPILTGNFLSQPAMKTIKKNSQRPESFPGATLITDTAFMVGAHHALTDEQIEYLAKTLGEIAQAIL
jgi:CDP-6-deoxy-D-xylo-4-hexulose-3-dehydrase